MSITAAYGTKDNTGSNWLGYSSPAVIDLQTSCSKYQSDQNMLPLQACVLYIKVEDMLEGCWNWHFVMNMAVIGVNISLSFPISCRLKFTVFL